MTSREVVWRKISLKSQLLFICARDSNAAKLQVALRQLQGLVSMWNALEKKSPTSNARLAMGSARRISKKIARIILWLMGGVLTRTKFTRRKSQIIDHLIFFGGKIKPHEDGH